MGRFYSKSLKILVERLCFATMAVAFWLTLLFIFMSYCTPVKFNISSLLMICVLTIIIATSLTYLPILSRKS